VQWVAAHSLSRIVVVVFVVILSVVVVVCLPSLLGRRYFGRASIDAILFRASLPLDTSALDRSAFGKTMADDDHDREDDDEDNDNDL
jgi:hypothetical protein